jgi:hypothetical protein
MAYERIVDRLIHGKCGCLQHLPINDRPLRLQQSRTRPGLPLERPWMTPAVGQSAARRTHSSYRRERLESFMVQETHRRRIASINGSFR